jgi:hypothetical protein
MHSQSPHCVTPPVVRNVQTFSNRQNPQKRWPSGNSQLPPAERRVSVPPGERDSSQGESSIASTIHGQNSTPASSLNNSGVADITQPVTATPSATQRRSIITPTATPGSCSHNTPRPSGITKTDSTSRVVSSPASGISSTPTPLSGLETFLPASGILKPAQSLQIHCERKLQKGLKDRGSGNCNRRRCLHLDQWSQEVAASINLLTPT